MNETHTLLCSFSQTKIFRGRSIATLGAACINGVPAFGLPKISSLVGRIFSPTFSASPLWSTIANSITPLLNRIPFNFSTVCSTE